ncbi:MAG: HAD family hydrolase [Lentisphaerae bacterium]|nr:HAD family hydrolase [Lentisphaerota bacterium]
MKRCVFFDRDGVVNVSPGAGYVERAEDLVITPGFTDVLRTVLASGCEAVIVTNQRAVALGILTEHELDRIHARLESELARESLRVLDIIHCPHDRGECTCRKPQPGMLLEAARRHGIDLASSWMVGDQERDIEAGRRAGCRTVLLSGGETETTANHRVADMGALEALLRRVLQEDGPRNRTAGT